MEDESVTSTDSTASIHTKTTTKMKLTPVNMKLTPVNMKLTPVTMKLTPVNLYRVGSGASVILDNENGIEAESRKLPSSRFKGVVPQPNGRWGAQIYEKHQRVWLGTFNEEESAAKAYDIAAQRFRGRDAVTNFKPSPETFSVDNVESAFLNSHSKLEIVDMLRKHTYKDELEQSKNHFNNGVNSDLNQNRAQFGENFQFTGSDRVFLKAREQLFVKTVTPSDVGKLNRLVIPKQHAEKYFPLQNGQGNNCTSKGVLLNFEDMGRKVWRFRYSYWNSSQSYVLTKGWSRFVKEKNLKAGDIVSFQRSIGPDNKQLYIDWKTRDKNGSDLLVGLVDSYVQTVKSVQTVKPVQTDKPVQIDKPVQTDKQVQTVKLVQTVQTVRLFGVNILKVPICSVVDNSSASGTNSGKRIREIEFLSLDYGKKQRENL